MKKTLTAKTYQGEDIDINISIDTDTDVVIATDHFHCIIETVEPTETFDHVVEIINDMIKDGYFNTTDDMDEFWAWYSDMETAADNEDMINVMMNHGFVTDEMAMA